MLRMCFPNVAGVCDFLSDTTNAIFQGHGMIVKSGCHFCDEDGCNRPPTSLQEYGSNAAASARVTRVALLATCAVLTAARS
ncbi:hypothetical protein PR048_026532 [Dryococelus australis]|uniref:Uncharacterized protein n=1 Tax=Dryococelus australis TaxID=614101 RepID=A0ABQ9GLL7_9NEOP|nr:hypothetical protein PR048_026532 [Dryococelus australis]